MNPPLMAADPGGTMNAAFSESTYDTLLGVFLHVAVPRIRVV